jgi:predicted transcriptional regulator
VEGEDLASEDRGARHEAIRDGFEDAQAGRTIDADEWAVELRAPMKIV